MGMSVSGVSLNGGFSIVVARRGERWYDGGGTFEGKYSCEIFNISAALSEMKAIIFYVRIFRLNVPAVDKQIQI